MAKDDITLSRREHRELVRRAETILKHHTNRKDADGTFHRSVFDETHDAELHEDEGFDIHDCPHCSVITHAQEIRSLINGKVAEARRAPVDETPLPPPPPAVVVPSKRARADKAGLVKGPE